MAEESLFLSRTFALSEPFGSLKDIADIKRMITQLRTRAASHAPEFHSVVIREFGVDFRFVYANPLNQMFNAPPLESIYDSISADGWEEGYVRKRGVGECDALGEEDEGIDVDQEDDQQATADKLLH